MGKRELILERAVAIDKVSMTVVKFHQTVQSADSMRSFWSAKSQGALQVIVPYSRTRNPFASVYRHRGHVRHKPLVQAVGVVILTSCQSSKYAYVEEFQIGAKSSDRNINISVFSFQFPVAGSAMKGMI